MNSIGMLAVLMLQSEGIPEAHQAPDSERFYGSHRADTGRVMADFVRPRFPVRVIREVPYASPPLRTPSPASRRLTLDLYEPTGKDAPRMRPAFVAVHGGGWRRGSKRNENIVDLCERLAERGYLCAAIDYRLLDDDPAAAGDTPMHRALNAAVDDAGAAVQWLVRNAGSYRIDPARIAIGGSSAGAITSLRLAYERRNRHVGAVLSWSGGLEGDEEIVSSGGPPLIIIHGAADRSIPVSEARALSMRARSVGLVTMTCICEDIGHNAPLDRRPGGVPLYDRIARFLFDALNLSKIATSAPPSIPDLDTGSAAVPCPH